MSNTHTLPSAVEPKRIVKVDLRSVIIVAILSFGAGAYAASSHSQAAGAATPAKTVALKTEAAGPSPSSAPTTVIAAAAKATTPGK